MADRDYYRKEFRENTGPMAQITPVVKWLLILNLAIYFLDTLVLKSPGVQDGPIRNFGAFTIQSAIFEGKIWEFITFQFIHGSFPHVLFNSMGIFFFGPWMERWWGSKKFLIFYLLCGVAGAVFYTLLVSLGILHIPDADILENVGAYLPGMKNPMTLVPLVGASAGIYGIFVGVAVIAPSLRVRLLFPPIELSMRQLAIGLLAYAVVVVVMKWGNEGGQAGHLGGAILGFILVKFPHLLGHDSDVTIVPPKVFSRAPEPKLRPRSPLEKEQDSELDRILDKISAQGFHSLTDEEKATLQALSNSKNSR